VDQHLAMLEPGVTDARMQVQRHALGQSAFGRGTHLLTHLAEILSLIPILRLVKNVRIFVPAIPLTSRSLRWRACVT
jgi:hypothetical protein